MRRGTFCVLTQHDDHGPCAEKTADYRKEMAAGRPQEAPGRVGHPHRRTALGGGGGNWPVCAAPSPSCKLTLSLPATKSGSGTGSSANVQSSPLATGKVPPNLALRQSRRSGCNSTILPQIRHPADRLRPQSILYRRLPVLNLVRLARRIRPRIPRRYPVHTEASLLPYL